MRRFRTRTLFFLVPVIVSALVLGVPAGSSTVGLQSTTLACNDGTDLALALDFNALTQLTNAVSAINLYPAGDPALACSLSQATPLSVSISDSSTSSAAGNPGAPHDYAVGGGQRIRMDENCGAPQEENFGLSAHVDDGTTTSGVGGTFNLSVSQANATTACPRGDLVSKVICLYVSGNTALLAAEVKKADGVYSTVYGFAPGRSIFVGVQDNGTPTPPVLTDLLDWSNRRSHHGDCNDRSPATPIEHGNISVNDATP